MRPRRFEPARRKPSAPCRCTGFAASGMAVSGRPTMWAPLGLALLVAGWGGVFPAAAAGGTTNPGMAVTVAAVAKACLTDTLHLAGAVLPREENPAKPDAEGWRIKEILVEDGDTVMAGQVLARLSRLGTDPNAAPTGSITAPTAGIVLRGAARVGVVTSPRADPPFRIVAAGEFELEAEIPSRGMNRIKLGQRASAEIPGAGRLSGRVSFISPDVNPMTQLGRTRVFIGADPKLRKGQFGKATVEIGRSCGNTVPFSSILYGPDGPVVQVVRNNRVETRRVRVGLTSGERAEVIDGVSEGDQVVTRAGSFLRDGDAVSPVPAREEAASARR